MKNYAPFRALISFWLWIGVIFLSFMLAVLAIATTVPRPILVIVALVIFVAAIAVPVINPGVFAKQHTTETGN